ncbi:glycine cleavage system protein GcvH [Nocardiopsis mangrovi]|uniref:Glycine cleavage system H protein n=1 Tax=Nocardiopsis mangrovi TaxID=1179818 RepID=A0ABV9DSQ0_9ACTN
MSDVPEDLAYTSDHEWVRDLGGGRVRVGITDFAQRQLGDIVFVDTPDTGDAFEAGEPFGTVESVKAVSELYAPLAGTVDAVNEAMADSPENVNDDPYGDGWFIELSGVSGSDTLLTPDAYRDLLKEGEGG